MVAELIGPAGSGKSILTERLCREPGALRASIWKLPRPQWMISALLSLPTLVALCIRTRSIPWEDLRHIIRLRALHGLLQRQRAAGTRLVLLDEGPVFALAWLQVYGQDRLRHAAMAAWWRDAAQEWARALDTVVVLDAPDPVLAQRVRGRTQSHSMKQKSDADIARFTAAYRTAFARVLEALHTAGQGHVRILTLRSEGESVDGVAAQLLKLLAPNDN